MGSDKVLGYLYNPVEDRLGIKFVFNPAKKRKGAKFRPDLTLNDVDSFIKTPQSRRSLLAICNAVYDPLGLVTPFTSRLKILMKKTLSLNNPGDWDSPVSTSLVKEWASALKEGITQDSLYFPRGTSSSTAVKKPRLVGFWDGSSQAFSAAVYVIFMVSKHKDNNEESLPEGDLEDKDYNPEEHEFISQLVAAKARVTPLKTGLTIPRSELSGLLLCTRLLSRIVSLYSGGFGSVSCLGDSTCIISSLDKTATSFNLFMHARLSEIHNLRDKLSSRVHLEEVFHVASADNISDICTRRESHLSKLGEGSSWQTSPSWLRTPCYTWPCTRDFNNKALPQEEIKTPIKVVMAARSTASSSSIPQFVIEEQHTFSEAAISLAKSISTAKRLRRDFAPFSSCLSQAKQILYEESMKETDYLLSQGRLRGYDVETKEGYTCTVHYTTGRF